MNEKPLSKPATPSLGHPRFSLGTLFVVITAISVVLASYTWLGGYGALLVALFELAIVGHVAGNWIGTRLREIGNLASTEEESQGQAEQRLSRYAPVNPRNIPPVTRLGERTGLSWTTKLTILAGTILGAGLGAVLLVFLNGPHASWAAIGCGATAFGVLAGIWTFAVASFIQIGWKAWSQASKNG